MRDNKLIKTVSESGMPARIFLAFLATAGFFYVNIMPALVDSLKVVLEFSNTQATGVGSANIYGAAVGAFLIIFVIKKIQWKKSAYAMLGFLIVIDLLSLLISTAEVMLPVRFLHGFFGGCLTAIAFSVIARQDQPDKTFGVLLAVQFGLGGVAVMLIPKWVETLGMPVLFFTLVGFCVLTLIMTLHLGEYPQPGTDSATDDAKGVKETGFKFSVPLVSALLAIFLFQAGNMGLYAIIIGLGKHYSLTVDFISNILGIAAWIGIAGSLLVVAMSTRYGYVKPLLAGLVLTIAGNWILIYSNIPTMFVIANVLVGITWAFVIPYLLGMISRFDESGQMASVGSFASKMGLASGPILVGYIIGEDQYETAVYWVVAALVICLFCTIIPAKYQDKQLQKAV